MKLMRPALLAAAAAGCLVLLSVPGANLYYRSSWGAGCAGCHEIRANFDTWRHSSHRKLNCEQCHSSSLVADLRRVVRHAQGDVPEEIHLRLDDVAAMMDRCRFHRADLSRRPPPLSESQLLSISGVSPFFPAPGPFHCRPAEHRRVPHLLSAHPVATQPFCMQEFPHNLKGR